jgi:predicted nucleotidyltransferase
MKKAQRQKVAADAKALVASLLDENPGVIAAYSDGSFARGDMVRGSDVDIGFVVVDAPAEHKIHRSIIDGVLFEWGFFEKKHYEDVASILSNAGFVHDLASAKIWYDPRGFLTGIQSELRREYSKPPFIKKRAVNQLKIVETNFEEFKNARVEDGRHAFLVKLFLIIRHLFAVPSAAMNRPVTNSRAHLFCKRDSQDLGLSDYPDSVLEILGSGDFTAKQVDDLLAVACGAFDTSGVPSDEIRAYQAHLEIVRYVLEIGEAAAAAWPLFFWTVGSLNEVKREGLADAAQKMEESFSPIWIELRLFKEEDIKARTAPIERAVALARRIVTRGPYGA